MQRIFKGLRPSGRGLFCFRTWLFFAAPFSARVGKLRVFCATLGSAAAEEDCTAVKSGNLFCATLRAAFMAPFGASRQKEAPQNFASLRLFFEGKFYFFKLRPPEANFSGNFSPRRRRFDFLAQKKVGRGSLQRRRILPRIFCLLAPLFLKANFICVRAFAFFRDLPLIKAPPFARGGYVEKNARRNSWDIKRVRIAANLEQKKFICIF